MITNICLKLYLVNMLSDRTVTDYSPVIFERKMRPVKAQVSQYVRLENGGIINFL